MEIITGHISIKTIFENNRNYFLSKNKSLIRENTISNIEKILACGSKKLGFASYKCDNCSEVKHIPFTCKSRFCNSCSKPQSDIRMKKLTSWRPQWLFYNHIIFTIPEPLRDFFKRHRGALKVLAFTAAHSVKYFCAKKDIVPWILAVIHTFWAQLNRNPHVHLLVTHWWVYKSWWFINTFFFPITGIKSSRTKFLLKNIKDRTYTNLTPEKAKQEIQFLNQFYNYRNPETNKISSRYVQLLDKHCSFDTVIGYLWRYLKRPVISQSRIIHYNKTSVTFKYIDKKDKQLKHKTCSIEDFIWLLVQHLPDKWFRMVYYYWIFANRCKKKHIFFLKLLFLRQQKTIHMLLSFRERLIAFTWKDPLSCSCWWCFRKYKITIPWYPDQFFDTS